MPPTEQDNSNRQERRSYDPVRVAAAKAAIAASANTRLKVPDLIWEIAGERPDDDSAQ
jgi:hypothetical protein